MVQAGDPKQAIDCCVLLNHWSKAVELAEQHNFPQIEGLLTKQVGTQSQHIHATSPLGRPRCRL